MHVETYDDALPVDDSHRRTMAVRAVVAMRETGREGHWCSTGNAFVFAQRREDGAVDVFEAVLTRALHLDATEAMLSPAELERRLS